MSTPPTPAVHRTAWARALLLAVGAAVAVGIILLAFIWPTMTSSVKDLPIAVGGSSQQVDAFTKALDQKSPGTFDVTRVGGRQEATSLVRTRGVDGAVLLGARPEVLTASANGSAVAQIMAGVATQVQTAASAAAGAPVVVTTTDLAPLSSQDSRGLGLSAASFPMVLGGILGGILIALTVTGSWRRLLSVGVYAVLAGVGVTGILQGLFGVLIGHFWLNAATISLTMAATASFVVGMNALVGRAGIPIGSVTTMLIGNPLSAATQPLQFLAGPWGAVGQWFVPGASTTLVRDLSYFPDANPTFAWLVLAGWAALGLVATAVGHFRNQQDVHLEEPVAASSASEPAASHEHHAPQHLALR
jgi:hypothetical protein